MKRLLYFSTVCLAVWMAGCTTAPTPLRLTPPAPIAATPTSSPVTAPAATPPEFGLQPPSEPYGPQNGDQRLKRVPVQIQEARIQMAKSNPPQFFLEVRGALPTPCHQVRVQTSPGTHHQIAVEIYAVVDPQAVCNQMVKPLELNIPLGRFPAGTYQVWLNAKPVGEIQVP